MSRPIAKLNATKTAKLTRRNPSRFPSRPVLAATVSVIGLSLWAAPTASAQSLYVTADRTIAGGNPINGTFTDIRVGTDAANAPFPNLTADVTGGTLGFLNALNRSTVNISGGTLGRPPEGFIFYSSLNIAQGSTVNMTGGSLIGFVGVRSTGSDGLVNTFNMSGGTVISFIQNENGGIVNITGGTVTGNDDFNAVSNYGSGTVNVTGGSVASILGASFFGPGGTVNFGGTASTNSITSLGGTINISGGTFGSGGVTVRDTGITNFTGSGLTVTEVSTGPFYDENFGVNLFLSSYTLSGTLSNGEAVNTTISAGASFTNSGSLATFNAPALAPDLYVTTDQTVTGVYNYVNVGIDETFSTPSNPTATVATGTDTVYLQTYSNSITHMTGGLVRAYAFVTEQSRFDLSGGQVTFGIDSFGSPDSIINVSGGATGFLGVGGIATVSGGAIDFVQLYGGGTLIVQGNGLEATASTPVSHFWDPNYGVNYLAAASFRVTGTLTDGNTFDQVLLSSGATGTATAQTLAGPIAAPDLTITTNTTTNTIYNQVDIGGGPASPTVNFATGTDVGNVNVNSQSTLNIQDGVVHGTIFASKNTHVNITGGTVNSLFHSPGNPFGTGIVTVSGGTTRYIAPGNTMLVTSGTLGTLDTYGGAQVRVEGGDVGRMLLFGGSAANPTNIDITGGTVGTLDFKGPGTVVDILGGSVARIWGNGGSVYIYGGLFGPDALLNYRTTPTFFDIFGQNLLLSDAFLGTYVDAAGSTYNGAWYTVTGTLESGSPLNTRYFERNGTLSGPTSLVFNVAIPEPGTSLMLATFPTLALTRRRRN